MSKLWREDWPSVHLAELGVSAAGSGNSWILWVLAVVAVGLLRGGEKE